MKPNTLFANAVIGMIVTELLEANYRVEVYSDEISSPYIYAYPDGAEVSEVAEYWVLLHLDNDPIHIISDYSVNLEKVLAPVNKFCASLEE